MFKSWSKKNKTKAVFKLQFQATLVPKMKRPALMIALVPDEVGKPTVKLEKAAIQDGTCLWDNPIFEKVKLVRDAKSGKLHEKIYHFVVSTGSSKSGFLGEASIDFADFAAETEPLTVSLPLKFANSGAILHVTIQNVEGRTDQRNGEDSGGGSLKHQLSNRSTDESSYLADEDSSRLLPPIRTNSLPSNGRVEVTATKTHMHRRSNTNWSMGSASDGSLGDLTNSLEDNLPRERLQGPSDNGTENLKAEIASLKRQAEASELELQSLRKQLEKESTRGQNMARQIIILREERNMLKTKYEQLNSQQNLNNENKTSKTSQSGIEDTRLQLEAIKEELVYEKELNASLHSQLQKTQNSNSELVLAVRELEAMLELRKKETLDNTDRHNDATELDLLRQKIADQNRETDICYKQREEINEHIKELPSDYELLKKENLDISLRLKQRDAQQIMLQNEHSASLATIEQLESQVERLEEKIKNQEDEFSESLVYINELENQVTDFERELKTQAEKFEEDLHSLKFAKIEQEERAMEAEEALRKTIHNNALTSESFQDEFRRLSVEMALKVDENEKMIIKANAEADELRKQNKLMEEMLQKCNQELRLITNQNELKLQELLNQIDSTEKTVEMMSQELDIKSKQLEDVQRHKDEKNEALSKQIELLRIEIKKLMVEEHALSNKAKPTEQRTKLLLQDSKDEEMILGTLMSEVETLKIHHKELRHSLHKEQVEKEHMMKKMPQLEGELKKKEAELSIMAKKLKSNKGQAAATHMNLTSRDNECAAPLTSTEEHIKMSKSEWHKGMDAANTAVGSEEKGKKGKSAENKVCLAPHRSEVKTCSANEAIVFNYDHNGQCHTNELLNEMALLKERNKHMESELKELEERYSEISLKFAEVEGERQQLVMALRNIKNFKN